jgi:predicted nucleotidyltransferase
MEKEPRRQSPQWSVFLMKSKEQQRLDLNEIVNSVAKNQSVIGIILFGSQARGDYDEFSDYDLLILFENKTLMWQNWDDLFQAVGILNMNLHAVPETIEELKNANPVFLEELFKHGKVLFAKIPFEAYLQPINLEPFFLITYDMRNVTYAEKMKASYFLYSKGNKGAVAKAGGIKVCDGCIIVPSCKADGIVEALSSHGVQTKKIEIFVRSNTIKSWQNKAQFLETLIDSKSIC